jgi:hypothetical protein
MLRKIRRLNLVVKIAAESGVGEGRAEGLRNRHGVLRPEMPALPLSLSIRSGGGHPLSVSTLRQAQGLATFPHIRGGEE